MTIEKPRTEVAAPDEQSGGQPEKKSPAINVPGLLAGAATAATMSVIGGHLSVVGTVLGAALTSIVSGVAVVVYSASLEKSRHGLEKVRTVVSRKALFPAGSNAPEAHGSSAVATGSGAVATGSRWGALRPRLKPVLVSTGAILGLAVAAVFGVQALTGTELSGGTGTIQRSVTGENSVAVRSAGLNPSGTRIAPDTAGVVPADGAAPVQEAPTEAPLPADGLPTGAAPTGTGDGTTSGGELPAPDAQLSDSGATGTDAAAPAQSGVTGADAGAVPAAP